MIGTGWGVTTAHLPTLKASPDAEIAAIADKRPDVPAEAAEVYGIHTQYTDYQQMLEKEDLDGAVVARWQLAHYEAARGVPGARPEWPYRIRGPRILGILAATIDYGGAEGRSRTDTGYNSQRFLRPPRLPFRHFGPPGDINYPRLGPSISTATFSAT